MDPRQLDAEPGQVIDPVVNLSWVYILKSLTNAAITFIINPPPPPPKDESPGHDSKRTKTLPPGTVIVYKNAPPRQNRESKAPPPGHKDKVGQFHKCIYKLSLTLVAFLSQQIKLFFNDDTDHCNKNYIICRSLDSTYGRTKFYMIYINVI